MILRRLAEAIRGQNWFTVALEILIVVVGIFIGLQVNDWNQARIDRGLEARYLERLHADLLTDLGRMDRSENLASIRMRQVERLLDGIADPEVAASQPIQFIEAVEKASWSSYRPLTPNAYAELIGIGRTTLIRSESIRDELSEYYARIDFWNGVLDRASLEREFSIASAGVLKFEYLVAIEKSGPALGLPKLAADGGGAVTIAEKLKSRTQATRLLPVIYKSHYMVMLAIEEHRERNEALQIAIEKYLKGARDDP